MQQAAVFSGKSPETYITASTQMNCRDGYQLIGEHTGAFSGYIDRYFSQELPESKVEIKIE